MRSVLSGIAAAALTATIAGGQTPGGVQLQIGDARVVEGHTGMRTIDVLVALSNPAPAPTTVAYTTRDLTATAGADYVAASGTLTFGKGQLSAKVTINVIGDVLVEASETLEIVLTNPSAKTPACSQCTGTVTIANDDFPAGPAAPAVYEVRFTFSGYTGSNAGAPDCPVRRNGRAVMTGLVSGNERVASDDDIEYRGDLQFDADLDLCEVHDVGGQHYLCGISVAASGPMSVKLAVYEGDRGGYVQTEAAKGRWTRMLGGTCQRQVIDEELIGFPDNSRASVFDGEPIELRSGPLRVGKYPSPPGGAYAQTFFEVVRKVR